MSLPMDHNYFNYHEKRSGGCFDGPFKKTPPAPPKPFSSVGENQPLGITPFEPRAVVAGWQIIEAAIRIIATLSDWLGYARRFLYPVAPSIASAYRCDHEDSRRPANPISALPDRSSCSGGTMGFQDDQGPDDRGDSDLCLLTDDKARKGARLSLSGRKSLARGRLQRQ